MEDTKSLLMMVLHKIFENHPKIVENTFQLIHNYNNGKYEKKSYEEVLKSICELMNDKLPSPILVYLLTLVDMPAECESPIPSPIMEKMKKTHDHLPDINVRPHLLEYLNSIKPLNSKIITTKVERKPRKKARKNCRPANFELANVVPKSLEELCANFVIMNENKLKLMYKKKLSTAWKAINSENFSGGKLEQCYEVVRDLNKKSKLLRGIENENITNDLIIDDPDVLLREKHKFEEVNRNPFRRSPRLRRAINSYLVQ